MDEAKERFVMGKIEVVFTPQCTKCGFNINYKTCDKFKQKPAEYMDNSQECPKKVLRQEP